MKDEICIKCGFLASKRMHCLFRKSGWCALERAIEVLKPREDSWWDKDELNRPSVIKVNGIYKMWYSGQMAPYTNEGKSYIGYAQSVDGINWERFDAPVLVPDQDWELKAIMCPHVIYDETEKNI